MKVVAVPLIDFVESDDGFGFWSLSHIFIMKNRIILFGAERVLCV
jgi:hypothetical protein